MDVLTMFEPAAVAPETSVLPAFLPIPGLGVLPMNAFLIAGAEPVLVDAGPGPLAAELMAALSTLIDPGELRYLWLTHTDPDHVGALDLLAEAAPDLRVVTTFLGRGKLALQGRALGDERFVILEPGQALELADRHLVASRPPTYDAPETLAALDTRTGACFCADTFGSVLPEPVGDASALEPKVLRDGLLAWTSVDVPWLGAIDEGWFLEALVAMTAPEPAVILSGHLPPAAGMARELAGHLAAVRGVLAAREGAIARARAEAEAAADTDRSV